MAVMEVSTMLDKLELMFGGMERTPQLVPPGLMLLKGLSMELTLDLILLKSTG